VEADPEECLLPEEAKINFSFQLSKAKFTYKVVTGMFSNIVRTKKNKKKLK
jgi:hypothetical protein